MTTATATTRLDRENPWPGLEAFDENGREFFHGRDHESAELLNYVLDAPVTILYARSGLGKTSLLKAGVFPLLRDGDLRASLLPVLLDRDFLPVYVRFELKPGAAPLSRQLHQSVYDSIRANVPDAMLPSDEESLWEYLHRADFELWSARNYPLTPVIVLDQFEELFTLGERVPDLVEEFRNDLGDLAENRIPVDLAARMKDDEAVPVRFQLRSRNYKLLISLREDFLPALEEWRRLIPALGRARMRLRPLRTHDALDAVHKPAEHLMTDALARRVVGIIAGEDLHRDGDTAKTDGDHPGDHTGASEVEPALLSLFCRELNEERKRRGQAQFDEQLVEDAGRDILSNFYASCVRDLPPRVARFIESELITEKGFRNSYAREDAVPSRLADDELDRLIRSRLLRLEEYHGAERIELTHDVLTGVVREHRDRRRAEEEKAALADAAEQERQALTQAAARREAELDRERRVGRRLRRLSAVLTLVCVAAVVLAVVAVINWHSATVAKKDANARSREALAGRLTSQAEAMLAGGQPGSELAAVVKLAAAQRISSDPNVGALLNTLSRKAELRKVFSIPPGNTALSADGRRVVVHTRSGVVPMDTETGEALGQPFADPDQMIGRISTDGQYLAMSDKHDVIHLWDTVTRKPVGQPMTGSAKYIRAVAVTSDGRRVAASDGNDGLRLWNVGTGQQVGTPLTGHEGPVTALAFSPDNRRLASAGFDNTVRLWDATSGARLGDPLRGGDPRMGTQDATWSVAFSPDGHVIAAGGSTVGLGTFLSAGSPLRLWNADDGTPIGEKPVIGNYGDIFSVAFSPEGGRVVTAGTDKKVRLWDAHNGQRIADLLSFQDPVWAVAFNRQGNRVVSGSGGTIQVSDADPAARLPEETGGSKAAHLADSDLPHGVDTTQDQTRIVDVSQPNTLRWLDPDTGEQVGQPIVSDALRGISQFDVTTDNRWLAVAAGKEVRIIDASNGQQHGEALRGHKDEVNRVDISPDGQMVATASDDKTVRLWDFRSGKPIGEPLKGHQHRVRSAGFSDDGRRLFSYSSDSIRIWDAKTRKPIGKPIGGPGSFGFFDAMAVSEDSQRIAAASGNVIQQWDAQTGEPVGPRMAGHDKDINDLSYSPDGRYLVSVSEDRTLRFWDTLSGSQIGEPVDTAAVGETAYIGFSHDGRRVFISARSVSLDGTPPFVGGGVWEVPGPAAWTDALCDKLAANPSKAQWQEWVSPDIDYRAACDRLPIPPDDAQTPPPSQEIKLGFSGLRDPTSVALDAAGNIYVADSGNNRVVRLGGSSTTQTQVPLTGLNHPSGVAVDTAGNVYVADTYNNRVLKWSAASATQTELPFTGLDFPIGVAVDTAGSIYVADSHHKRVLKLTPGSATQTELPFTGVDEPTGVAVDASGNVYVTDLKPDVLKLSPGATTPTELPFHELGNPNGVAVDSAGNVYVVDDLYSQVLELQAAWNAPAELSVRGLMSPEAVAVDTVVGSLYVVDSGNNRVLKVPLRR